MYCLWIGGKKIDTLEQLKKNFDFNSVEIYCYGGGLAPWLRLCGEDRLAERVEEIDFSADVEEQLSDIFDVPVPKAEKTYANSEVTLCNAPSIKNISSFTPSELSDSFSVSAVSPNSFSADSSSFGSHSFGNSSFAASSFIRSSFAATEVGAYSFSNSLKTGSGITFITSFLLTSFEFFNTSFTASSFHEYEFEFETSGSFSRSSFYNSLSSFNKTYKSFSLSSSFSSPSGSSFSVSTSFSKATEEENSNESKKTSPEPDYSLLSHEEKLMLNINACPLNQFGYGLHLI